MVKILETIDLSYKDFDEVNLSFEDKTFYSIIGSNNSGKTTLFKLISGIIPSNDMVYCGDIDLNSDNIHDYIINFGIVERVNKDSFIFNSVSDEMTYPLHNLCYSKSRSIDRVKDVLDLFDASNFIDEKINELNEYEKQLLLIMIAILHKPKVLLIDSVLNTFPRKMKERIIKVLKKLTEEMTIINFTSSLEEASFSDKLILLDKYKIVGEYVPSDIFKDDKFFYEHNLEIPLMTDLSVKLKMYNLVNKEYSDMKEMVDDRCP
jgi:energy-coupling factor transporter ATP-binding protein EcfA2